MGSTTGESTWVLMKPIATEEGAPEAVAFIGVWECLLLSSNMLEAALCLSAWRFYRVFREAGIYPPDVGSARISKEVSPFELVCEAEDVALLSDQCTACGHQQQDQPSEIQTALPYPTVGVMMPGIPPSAGWLADH